jgi:hypothetical protein
MLPAQLVQEAEDLRGTAQAVDLIEAEGWGNVVLHAYRLSPGFSRSETDLLLRIPLSYPNGRPDMFWTDADLTLASGGIPRSADHIEPALGKSWRRFSWHPRNWNPGVDTLRTYLEFVNARLAKAV